MTERIQITELSNSGDARGFSFTAPVEALAFVGRMADVHLASTKPGAVRGNHYHLRRREAIVVLPGAKWSLALGRRRQIGGPAPRVRGRPGGAGAGVAGGFACRAKRRR